MRVLRSTTQIGQHQEKEYEDEDEICVLRDAVVHRMYHCRRTTGFGELQPRCEFCAVPHRSDNIRKRNTKMKTKFAFCAMLLCIACTIAVGQQVSVNYNHDASFAQYHTYAWGSNNTNQIRNSILAQVAQQDINTAMQGKGLQMVQESQNPDLILVATGGEREQTSYSAWGMRGIGGGMGGISQIGRAH